MAKTALPTSKATNAYELLSEVCEAIRAEPKRYNQWEWLERGTGRDFPACGTVACVAGWVVTLKRSATQRIDVIDRAASILGLFGNTAWELFDGEAAGTTTPQTPAHVQAGIKHIRRFQKKYAAQLKAKVV